MSTLSSVVARFIEERAAVLKLNPAWTEALRGHGELGRGVDDAQLLLSINTTALVYKTLQIADDTNTMVSSLNTRLGSVENTMVTSQGHNADQKDLIAEAIKKQVMKLTRREYSNDVITADALEWIQKTSSSKVFAHVFTNSGSPGKGFKALKSSLSTLSSSVKNQLRGILVDSLDKQKSPLSLMATTVATFKLKKSISDIEFKHVVYVALLREFTREFYALSMEGRNKRDFWAWVSNQFAMRATDPAWGANLKDGRWPAYLRGLLETEAIAYPDETIVGFVPEVVPVPGVGDRPAGGGAPVVPVVAGDVAPATSAHPSFSVNTPAQPVPFGTGSLATAEFTFPASAASSTPPLMSSTPPLTPIRPQLYMHQTDPSESPYRSSQYGAHRQADREELARMDRRRGRELEHEERERRERREHEREERETRTPRSMDTRYEPPSFRRGSTPSGPSPSTHLHHMLPGSRDASPQYEYEGAAHVGYSTRPGSSSPMHRSETYGYGGSSSSPGYRSETYGSSSSGNILTHMSPPESSIYQTAPSLSRPSGSSSNGLSMQLHPPPRSGSDDYQMRSVSRSSRR